MNAGISTLEISFPSSALAALTTPPLKAKGRSKRAGDDERRKSLQIDGCVRGDVDDNLRNGKARDPALIPQAPRHAERRIALVGARADAEVGLTPIGEKYIGETVANLVKEMKSE